MFYQTIDLKEKFPALAEKSNQPTVTVYLPDNIDEMGRGDWKKPCMVICPGGGYGYCSQREAEPVALHFLTEGYNVFVINYSVCPYCFPVQLLEVAAVMELIYENAENWRCDTSKVAIMGFSAGGHLAAHYSNSYNIPEVRAVFPQSKPVQASVLCYPVITADPACAHMGSFQNLLGVEKLTPQQEDGFSCDKLVSDQTPPAFLWHTATDGCVPVENSLRYALALSRHQIPFSMHIYPVGDHGLSTADHRTNGPLPEAVGAAAHWIADCKKWLQLVLN